MSRISEMADDSSLSGSELVPLLDGSINKRTTVGAIAALAQAPLVSGTNIKTINGSPILGGGNIVVAAGASDFSSITGLPADNPALVSYVAAHSGSGSARQIFLSLEGVPDGADVEIGSTTFGADGHAAVTAVMAGAEGCIVHWDVATSLSDEVVLPNNVKILGYPGKGAIMRDGANKAMFVNANQTFDPGQRNDHDITIFGGIWNGNAKGQTLVGSGSYGQISVLRFYGMRYIRIFEAKVFEQKCYAIDVINCELYHVEKCTVDEGPPGATFNDGIHWNFCDKVVIRDCKIRCHDDAIAGNTDDQYLNPAGSTYPFYLDAGGPSSDVWIENIVLDSHLYGLRLLSGGSRMDNITIKGISGTTNAYGVIIDNYQSGSAYVTQPGSGNIGRVHLENINVNIASTGSVVNTAVINIACSIEQLKIVNSARNDFNANCPFIRINGSNTLIKSAELIGFNSYDPVTNQPVDVVLIDEATVNNLTTNDIKVYRFSGSLDVSVVKLIGAAKVDIYQANGINCGGIQHILNNHSGFIKAVTASNVTHFNTLGGASSFKTNTLVPRITLSNYLGETIIGGASTFTTQLGDGFASGGAGGSAIAYSLTTTPPAYVGNESAGTDLTFTNAASGVTNTSQIFTAGSGNNGWSGNGAYDNASLAESTAGGVIQFAHQLLGPSIGSGVVGFLTSAAIPTDQTSFYAGFNCGGSDKITLWQNGAGSLSSYSWKLGRWYRMWVDAAGAFSVQETSDGVTWTIVVLLTGLAAYTGQKWPGMVLYGNPSSNSVRYPKRTW